MARTRKSRDTVKAGRHYLRLIQISIILCCLAGIYILWLDVQVRTAFEGKKWLLPARVYASPVELYPGRALTTSELQGWLLALGYERNESLSHSGQFRTRPDALEFISRPVTFWSGSETSRQLRVTFHDGQVEALHDMGADEHVNVMRLEPELIGKIYPRHNEDRVLVEGDEIPGFLIDALITAEDRGFFRHHGIDIRGILRAVFANLRSGRITQGGSTLTQQLVKNYFLSPDRTLWRKLNEMVMAMLLERHYSKDEILYAYINEIFLGQHGARAIHGFGTAAEFYFARPLNELRDDQLALLVALVRGASYYNPRKHPQRARDRRDLVLDIMHEQGYLSSHDLTSLQTRPLDVADKPIWTNARYPAFLDLVRRQLLQDYRLQDLQNEGLKIFTTLDVHLQGSAQRNAAVTLRELEQARDLPGNQLQMAAVIVRIGTGDVVTVIGGRDVNMEGFNRALDARRPIGSLIKPMVYLTALDASEKYNLLTPIDDDRITVKQADGSIWEPRNFDRELHGQVYLYDALRNSYNLATVRLGMEIGLDEIIATLRRTGIDMDIQGYPSLLLGTLELSPLEVAQMYQPIANGGFQVPLNCISEVLDNDNRPLQRYGLEVNQALDPSTVFLLNYILRSVVESGTARSLSSELADKLPLAGKTGTTNDLRDSWFAGYGDNLLAVTWLGYDNNNPTPFTGATGALRVWAALMRHADLQPVYATAPEDVSWLTRRSGLIHRDCPDLDQIPYITGRPPQFRNGCYTR